MKIKGGYVGRILEVDLSTEMIKERVVREDFAVKYVGGRGWGARMLYDLLSDKIRTLDRFRFMDVALSPENVLIIATGPLTGLYFPAAGKTSLVSISPATGIYADSNFGGMFGVELKQAGYDAIVIRGAARSLKYIYINDGVVEIRDASAYAGRGCVETERGIKEEIGDESVRVMCIGPAGENLVRFACVTTEWGRNAGRTGMGAVMGAKRLKAIAVQGSQDIPVHDLDALIEVSNRGYEYLRRHFLFDLWQRQGLMSVVDYINTMGVLPTYNYRHGVFERADDINGEIMERRYKIGDSACFACSMCCGNICLVKEGKYAGTVVEGPEYETACMFGPNLGVDDFSCIIRANYLCDDLGIDTITAGNLIGALMEAYEEGIVRKEDLGFELHWGDCDRILELLEKIARREGVGDVLAEGAYGVIRKWDEMRRLISHVKFLEQTGYDAHVSLCMALAYATCDIGAHHNRAWPIAKELEVGADWGIEEKVRLVIYHQTVRPLFDMLGVCRLPWIELGMDERLYAEAYTAATGVETSIEELLERSKMVYNLTRSISVLLGVRRRDDYPPERVFEEPLRGGPHDGAKLDRRTYEEALSLYYELRGWDEDGIPKEETLMQCGLEDVAAAIKELRMRERERGQQD